MVENQRIHFSPISYPGDNAFSNYLKQNLSETFNTACREYGSPFQKQFECSCSIVVAEKKFSAKATASSKKGAQKKCALEMVIQLYKVQFLTNQNHECFRIAF